MRTIKIGKSSSNDYVIGDNTVSRQHAALTIMDDGKMLIKDLNSTNGTFVNGKRITTDTVVQSTDQIRLGNYSLNISDVLKPKTVIRKNINPNRRTIGRNNESDIVIPGNDVSSNHAVLELMPSGEVAITDSGSTNGTFVNGQRITRYVLHKGDQVTISHNHPLQWETVFPSSPTKTDKIKTNQILRIAAVAIAVIAVVGLIWLLPNSITSPEKIYRKYSPAVCFIQGEYGFHLKIDGVSAEEEKEYLSLLNYMDINVTPSTLLRVNDGKVTYGTNRYEGTGFFITEDGKIATNLHIAKPWLYGSDGEKMTLFFREKFTLLSEAIRRSSPQLYSNITSIIPNIRAEGVLIYIGVNPNGLPLSYKGGNMTECTVYRAGNDAEKDVAIIQTVTRKLPENVSTYVNLSNAQTDNKATEQGATIITIGYPIGSMIATVKDGDDSQIIQNQLQTGTITQNRGDIEFAHNAPTYGGASGEPIFDKRGRLIGIHHAGLSQVGVHGFNWAIKAQYLIDLTK